jgi:hypothetical protein
MRSPLACHEVARDGYAEVVEILGCCHLERKGIVASVHSFATSMLVAVVKS